MSHWGDLNPRPPDYESGALPTKLQWRQALEKIPAYEKFGPGTRLSAELLKQLYGRR